MGGTAGGGRRQPPVAAEQPAAGARLGGGGGGGKGGGGSGGGAAGGGRDAGRRRATARQRAAPVTTVAAGAAAGSFPRPAATRSLITTWSSFAISPKRSRSSIRSSLGSTCSRPRCWSKLIILSVTLDDNQQLGVNFSVIDRLQNVAFVNGSANAINNMGGFKPAKVLTTAPIVTGSTATPSTALTNLQPGFAFPVDQGLRFGFITHNIAGFVQALETLSKVNILASPRVLVLNKQRAEIQLGQRLGYRNTVTNLTSSLQTVDFLSVGTLLTLRPYVATDGMNRMEIHPEKSTGALDANGIPQTNTQELTTNILVPDGSATIVIGGLIDDQDSVAQTGIPGLSRLQRLGFLFRNRVSAVHKSELIVLLTPRILQRGGMPEPVPGVAPMGPMKIPNSGAMPGPAYVAPGPALSAARDPGDWGPPTPSEAAAVAADSASAESVTSAPVAQPPSAPAADATQAAAAAAPNTAPAGARPTQHVVAADESLSIIAERYYGSARYHYALWMANRANIPDPNHLPVGTTILLPPSDQLDRLESLSVPSPRDKSTKDGYHAGDLTRAVFRRISGDAAPPREPKPAAPSPGYKPGDITRSLARRIKGDRGPATPKSAADTPSAPQPVLAGAAAPGLASVDGRVEPAGFARDAPSVFTVQLVVHQRQPRPRWRLRPPRVQPPCWSTSCRRERTSSRSPTITTNRRLSVTPSGSPTASASPPPRS